MTSPNPTISIKHENQDFPITIRQLGNSYKVVYGKRKFTCKTYEDAALQLGCALMNSLNLAGLLESEEQPI